MKSRNHSTLDEEKFLNPKLIRINMLLASLYITAFELLKYSIIEGTKDAFLFQDLPTSEHLESIRASIGDQAVKNIQEAYEQEAKIYENELGIRVDERDFRGFIPSTLWLCRMGIITEGEVNEIKQIRDHRNEIAHELPKILLYKDFDVNIDFFFRMFEVLKKIDVFWARNDLMLDPTTLDEIDISEIPDDQIISGRVALLQVITQTVQEYLEELSK